MSEEIQILNSKTLKARIILSLLVIIALVFAWFAVRWQLGDMLAGGTIRSGNTDPVMVGGLGENSGLLPSLIFRRL